MKRGKIAISIVLILVLSISAQAITFTDLFNNLKDFFSGTPTGAQIVPLAVDGCTSFGAGGFPIIGATLTSADTITYSQTSYSAGSVSITVLAPPITASTMSITTTGGATFGTITIPAAAGLHVLPITLAASPLMPTLGGNCVITRTGGIGAFTVAAGATVTLTPIVPPPTPTPSAGGGGGGAKTKTWTYVERWEPEVTQPCKPGSAVELKIKDTNWNNADGLWFARQDTVRATIYENNNVKEQYTYKIEQTTDTPIKIPNSETWGNTGNTYQITLQTGYSGLKPIAPRIEYQVNVECPGTAVPIATAPPLQTIPTDQIPPPAYVVPTPQPQYPEEVIGPPITPVLPDCCCENNGVFAMQSRGSCGNCVNPLNCGVPIGECLGCPNVCSPIPDLPIPPQPQPPTAPDEGGGGGGGKNSQGQPPMPTDTYYPPVEEQCERNELTGGCVPSCDTPEQFHDHVLLSEIFVSSEYGQYIEIMNPTPTTIEIGDYHITNAQGNDPYESDWVIKFPPQTKIASGQYLTISLGDDSLFKETFGKAPDFEVSQDTDKVPNMEVTQSPSGFYEKLPRAKNKVDITAATNNLGLVTTGDNANIPTTQLSTKTIGETIQEGLLTTYQIEIEKAKEQIPTTGLQERTPTGMQIADIEIATTGLQRPFDTQSQQIPTGELKQTSTPEDADFSTVNTNQQYLINAEAKIPKEVIPMLPEEKATVWLFTTKVNKVYDIDIFRYGEGHPIYRDDKDTKQEQQHKAYTQLQWTLDRILGISPEQAEEEKVDEARKALLGDIELQKKQPTKTAPRLGILGYATLETDQIPTTQLIDQIADSYRTQYADDQAAIANNFPTKYDDEKQIILTTSGGTEISATDIGKTSLRAANPGYLVSNPVYRSYTRIDYNEGGERKPQGKQKTLDVGRFQEGAPTSDECNTWLGKELLPNDEAAQLAHQVLNERDPLLGGKNRLQKCMDISSLIRECDNIYQQASDVQNMIASAFTGTNIASPDSISKISTTGLQNTFSETQQLTTETKQLTTTQDQIPTTQLTRTPTGMQIADIGIATTGLQKQASEVQKEQIPTGDLKQSTKTDDSIKVQKPEEALKELCKILNPPQPSPEDIEKTWTKFTLPVGDEKTAEIYIDETDTLRYHRVLGTKAPEKEYAASTTQEGAYGIVQTRADKPLDTTVAENMDYNAYAMYIRTPVGRRSYDSIETVPNKQNLPPGTPSQQYIGGSTSPTQTPERDGDTTSYSYDNIPKATGIFGITGMQIAAIQQGTPRYNGLVGHDETSEHYEKTWLLSLASPGQAPDTEYPLQEYYDQQDQETEEPECTTTINRYEEPPQIIETPEGPIQIIPTRVEVEIICGGEIYNQIIGYEYQQLPQELIQPEELPQEETPPEEALPEELPPEAQPPLPEEDTYTTIAGPPTEVQIPVESDTTTITLPYYMPEGYNSQSIAGYLWYNNQQIYQQSTVNTLQNTVQLSIQSPQSFIPQTIAFPQANWCTTCDYGWSKVYDKGQNALVLVHGITTSPHMWRWLINDLTQQNYNGQIWAYGYPLDKSLTESAIKLADTLEQQNFPTIQVAAHNAGGRIIHEAINYAIQQGYKFPSRIKTIILLGSTTEAVKTPELYRNIFTPTETINKATINKLVNEKATAITDTIKPMTAITQSNTKYFAIAGTQNINENDKYFGTPNDGLLDLEAAKTINGKTLPCEQTYELPLTHNQLIIDETARKLITEILENKQQPISCTCGNGFCDDGETEQNCPTDCATIETPDTCTVLANTTPAILGLTAIALVYGLRRKPKKENIIFKILLYTATATALLTVLTQIVGCTMPYFNLSLITITILFLVKEALK